MQAKLSKIKLKPNSREKVTKLIEYMRTHIEEPKNEMEQKGYYWDSVFLDNDGMNDYLYVVTKSLDFSKIMRGEDGLNPTPFRKTYDQFKDECWAEESITDLETVHCFNKRIEL